MVNSEVFMAMFSHENTKEVREGRIQITDSTGTAVRQMLIYMYTGERPNDYAIETDAGPLMHLANKYGIQSLVQLIEQELINRFALKLGYQKLVDWHLWRMVFFLLYLGTEGSLRK
jgi:hypothetical protein